MAITRWNPIREMAAMQNLMDRMFDETWRSVRPLNEIEGGGTLLALDIHEDEKTYTVTTALPGVNADNINVRMHDDVLLIEAEMPERKIEQEGTRKLVQERVYGKYSRQVRLPHMVNAEKVEAQYEDGVLTLTLPKADNVLPRNIPVKRLGGGAGSGGANNN
jgi:HSP20 family protein